MDLKLEKFIVCDDIRTEESKKLLIVGMYVDDIIVVHHEFPYIHPFLSILMNISGDLSAGDVYYELISPVGECIFKTPPFNSKESANHATLTLKVSQLKFISPGTYVININFPHNKKISASFNVVKANDHMKQKE
jgi:hypothetical protein